jgi:phage repressor protein C with HTH and peptisase S24 domain
MTVVIPISGEARRGAYFEENRRRTGLGSVEVEIPPGLPTANTFAIRMADRSMDRFFQEGDLAIYRSVNWGEKTEHAADDTIVVVQTTYASLLELTVAKIHREEPTVYLRYLSSDYSMGGTCEFDPDRPPRGQPSNPFLQHRRKILGVVLTDWRVVPPREPPHALQSPDANQSAG